MLTCCLLLTCCLILEMLLVWPDIVSLSRNDAQLSASLAAVRDGLTIRASSMPSTMGLDLHHVDQ